MYAEFYKSILLLVLVCYIRYNDKFNFWFDKLTACNKLNLKCGNLRKKYFNWENKHYRERKTKSNINKF